jgi:flagellar FliJ protein
MSFRYRFQKVLNVREEMRKRAEQDLAVAFARRAEEQHKLDELMALDEQTREQASQTSVMRGMSAHELLMTEQYVRALKDQMVNQRRRLVQAEQLVAKSQQQLNDALQQQKMWEKDLERRKQMHHLEQLALEQKQMDEMAQSIIDRRRNSENH